MMSKSPMSKAWFVIKQGGDDNTPPSVTFEPCPMRITGTDTLYTGTCQQCGNFISEDDRRRCPKYD